MAHNTANLIEQLLVANELIVHTYKHISNLLFNATLLYIINQA